jgi:diguanylate cyclase (GGDEF)-like protein
LADALRRTEHEELVQLFELLTLLTSCYSTGEATGRRFVGTEALRRAGASAVVAVPVVALDRRIGMLVIANTSPHPFTLEDIQPLELLGRLGGAFLESAATIEALRAASTLDALTGVGNHGRFYDTLRASSPVERVLVVLDIDRFKQVNDTYGHPAGDAVLRSVAAALCSAARSADDVFRVGGDEFAVIAALPERSSSTSDASVAALAARLGAVVADALLPFGAGVSVGTCVIAPGDDAGTAYSRADTDLYRSKSRHRR